MEELSEFIHYYYKADNYGISVATNEEDEYTDIIVSDPTDVARISLSKEQIKLLIESLNKLI